MSVYTIQPHDTLDGLAKSNNTTREAILALNPTVKNPNLIFTGHPLNLPDKQPVLAPGTGMASTPGVQPAPVAAPVTAPTAQPDPQVEMQNQVAKELGYADFASFAKDTLQRPALDTEKIYNDAYSAQGLADILKGITDKKDKLNQALGTVNDNPWYDEAFRRGEASRLQNLAGTDIKNQEDLYTLKLGQVHDLVSREASDFSANQATNNTKLDYLHQKVSAAQAAQDRKDAAAATAAAKPVQTVSVGTNGKLYEVDPVTHQFKLVATGNAPVVKAKTSSTSASSSTAQKTLAAFTKAVANRATLDKAGTREQFARQLQSQFPDISPSDILRKVYETYPDHYNGK
jgi:LysM repeat protein